MPLPIEPTVGASASVGAQLTFWVTQPSLLSFQVVAATDSGAGLRVELDGRPVAVQEVLGPEPGARQHLVRCGEGELSVSYVATVFPGTGATSQVLEADRLMMMRPSRFCGSDRLAAYASTRFPGAEASALTRAQAIGQYVSTHLQYVIGSTGPTDDAVDVLLAGRGVCRDFAHLVVTLARAHGMAARFVAVYAPGLSPMDFHAVAEVEVDGAWHVVDATRLAPRASLVRIATGRDAADTSFATTVQGVATLVDVQVTAVADGGLPMDDGLALTLLS